ncbi:universal stress protein [Rhizobium sp. P28RR-XV]|uniref:universal stress protein n=1 Tax=Rhizobium sp. P28RR-XV TaxID=2726737 RepID=UPI0014577228|nr:universal stress protein [Rhizobium sp. P28RR-XV]NLR86138.1 universal stress protein [Rhizobium sp. P28RR-XV]
MPTFKHILVPTDGSKMASHAATQATSLADEMNAEVTLLAVTEPFHMLLIDSNEYLDQQQRHEKAAASGCGAMLARQKAKASDKRGPLQDPGHQGYGCGRDIVDTADRSVVGPVRRFQDAEFLSQSRFCDNGLIWERRSPAGSAVAAGWRLCSRPTGACRLID